jgi:hypothetical protein
MTRIIIILAMVFTMVFGVAVGDTSNDVDNTQTEDVALKRWTGCPPYC